MRKEISINDARRSRGGLEGILAASGHEVIVVNNTFLAVDIVVQKKPDEILLELSLPHKNGFELTCETNHVRYFREAF